MVVVSNHRHNSSPTTDQPRDMGTVGCRATYRGTGLSLPLQVNLAKSLSFSGPVSPLVKWKREKGTFWG